MSRFSVWCTRTHNLIHETCDRDEAIAVASADPEHLVVYGAGEPGSPAPVVYDRTGTTHYRSRIVSHGDGDRSVVFEEEPQLFLRSTVQSLLDEAERADFALERLLERLEQGEMPSASDVRYVKRCRAHHLAHAIRTGRRTLYGDKA